jgi:hypothetical protein
MLMVLIIANLDYIRKLGPLKIGPLVFLITYRITPSKTRQLLLTRGTRFVTILMEITRISPRHKIQILAPDEILKTPDLVTESPRWQP